MIAIRQMTLGLLLFGLGADALASPKAAATDKIAAALAPYEKLPPPDRETQVCANIATLVQTAKTVPEKPPKNVPLDATTWVNLVQGVIAGSLDDIKDLCARPDHKRTTSLGETLTAGGEIQSLYTMLPAAIDAAKPRTLPASLVPVRRGLTRTLKYDRGDCTRSKTLAKQIAAIKRPDRVDAAKWDKQVVELTNRASGLSTAVCAKHKPAPEEVGGIPSEIAEQLVKLVLLLPPD